MKNSVLLAQLAADKKYDREFDTENWYTFYRTVLDNVGWVVPHFSFTRFNAGSQSFTADKVIIGLLEAIATGNEISVVTRTLDAIKQLEDGDNRLVLFESHSHSAANGNFQISSVSEAGNSVIMKLGAFYFSAKSTVTRILWFSFPSGSSSFYQGGQTMELDDEVYSHVRNDIVTKLGTRAAQYIAALDIGG